MEEKMYKQIDKFEADYDKIASKEVWDPSDITKMKDLQKLMYYLEVRCAMKDGGGYPGSEYMNRGSYTGRPYTGGNRGSGHYPMDGGPWYYDNGNNMSGRRYYDGGMSGRRYYDDERGNAIEHLRQMMNTEGNQDRRMALQSAMRMLEER